eukprot:6169151-Prymnesium_polylepis.1
MSFSQGSCALHGAALVEPPQRRVRTPGPSDSLPFAFLSGRVRSRQHQLAAHFERLPPEGVQTCSASNFLYKKLSQAVAFLPKVGIFRVYIGSSQ